MPTVLLTMALDPARADDVARRLRGEVAPWVRRFPGFVAGRWLFTEDRDRCVVLLDFAEPEQARRAAESAAAEPRVLARAWNLTGIEVCHEVAATGRPPGLR